MRHVLRFAFGVLALVSMLWCAALRAAEPSAEAIAPPRIQSQLWLVSTRKLPHGSQHSSRRLRAEVERYDRANAWQPSSLDDLIAARDLRLTTVLLVHGNDTSESVARSKGLGIYDALLERTAGSARLIIWSWPADYVGGTLRHDARVKADRIDADACYLARFIGELDRDESLSLVGYSFGARLISGALHLVGGGALAGKTAVAGRDGHRAAIRAVLLAAAVDDDWLLPGRRYGRALSVVERLVVLVNPQDRVLRWYRFLSPQSGAAALGSRGLASSDELGANRAKIEQIDVAAFVGAQHRWSSYAGSAEILEQIKRETLLGANRQPDALVK
jgi:hypothetical protein